MKLISIIFSLIATVYSQQNIIEYLQTATGFDVCAGALIKLNTSAGIDVTTGGPYTVFCAPDTVWNPMGITDGSTLDDTLISYWIIMGEFNNSDLTTGRYTTMAKRLSGTAYIFDYNATSMQITDEGGNVVDTTTFTEVSTPGNIWITNTAVIYPGTIFDYLADNTALYSTLISVAAASTTVANALLGPGALTLFAPPNAAFGDIDEGVLSLLLASGNLAELEAVLTYHVVPAKVASSMVSNGLIAGTLQGNNLTFAVTTGIFVTDALIRGESCQIGVDSVDIFRSNGVVHSTACVLAPKSLADVVVENGLTSIAGAAVTYGVIDALLTPGGITLFGPTNAAFNAVNLTGFGPEDIAFILAYHTIPAGVPSAVVANFSGQNVPTSINATVRVDVGASVTITDSISQVSTVTVVDKFALNGILHIIDGVLFPASIVSIVGARPDTMSVAGLAVQAGLAPALTGVTVFIPPDTALVANLVALSSIPGRYASYIFQYHVLPDITLFENIATPKVATAASVALINTTSAETKVYYKVGIDTTGKTITDAVGNVRTITDLNIVGTDGIVNIIDNFLFPFDITALQSIDATAKTVPDLSTLVTAYTAAGLQSDLAMPNLIGLTIFAPVNSVFASLPDGLLPYLLTNSTLLGNILSFHAYNGTLVAQDLQTLIGQSIPTLGGISLMVGLTADGAAFTLTDPAGNVITITTFDVFCTNGIVHIIDKLIEPEAGAYDFTIADYINAYSEGDDPAFSFAGLSGALAVAEAGQLEFYQLISNSTEKNTLFAPNDWAFASANIDLAKLLAILFVPASVETLLNYHLVTGKALAASLVDGQAVTSFGGVTFTPKIGDNVEIMDMDAFSDNAVVTMADIKVTNGIIHIIDQVLGPSTGFVTRNATTIVDYLVANKVEKKLTTVTTQAKRSQTVIDVLDSAGPWTLFAPKDPAWMGDDISETKLTELLANITMVELLLSYHLVYGTIPSSNITDGMELRTLYESNLTASIVNGSVYIIDEETQNMNAKVVVADLFTDNGVIHIIDNVLIPEEDLLYPDNTIPYYIEQNKDAKLLTTLASILTPVVTDVLSMDGPYTLFAPKDIAFTNDEIDTTKLDAILAEPMNVTLNKLLKYHVVEGMIYSSNLTNGQMAQTLKGLNVSIKIQGSSVFIIDIETNNDDAEVLIPDIVVENGIIHLIDGVLSFEEGLLTTVDAPDDSSSNIVKPAFIIVAVIMAFILY